jgi:hypothetical protein
MATRTTKLAALSPAAGLNVNAFTVPAGFTYLVKSVIVYNRRGGTDTVQVYLNDPGNFVGVLVPSQVLASQARLEYVGLVALNPGDSLIVSSSNANSDFWVSGTKLVGVA